MFPKEWDKYIKFGQWALSKTNQHSRIIIIITILLDYFSSANSKAFLAQRYLWVPKIDNKRFNLILTKINDLHKNLLTRKCFANM